MKMHFKRTDLQKFYNYLEASERPVISDVCYIENARTGKCTNADGIDNTDDAILIRFTAFDRLGFVKSGFSTRIGGVSTGIYESMNLTFNLEDSKENVLTNFYRIGRALDIDVNNMVYSKQTHTTNCLEVKSSERGMGILRERNFDNIDGIYTDEKDVCLVTSYADCIPLLFADPVKKCIAASHSGWRGTVGNIAKNTVDALVHSYKSNPKDIVVVIGPGICPDCYEVSGDVADAFRDSYKQEEYEHFLIPSSNEGKYQLNLPLANYYNLRNAGIRPENINICDLCTCCNSRYLFSHRATGGKRGILCAFLEMI